MATVYMLTTANEQVAGYSTSDFRRLSQAAACDTIRRHQLVDSPEAAAIILFVGSTDADHRDVRQHPLRRLYPDKCFLFHSGDHVIPFLPGVYVNISRRWYSRRTKTGPYLQMLDWDHVPYVPSLQQCEYLFSFVGSVRSHEVRARLMKLKHPRAYLEDTNTSIARADESLAFAMVAYTGDDRTRFGDVISRSKFVLCPRGYACSTWRLFESMKAGRIPVIVSDQWVPPAGPEWDTFSIRVKERHVSRIPELLDRHESDAEAMARAARAAWEEWFSRETVFHRVVEWCLTLGRDSGVYLPPYAQLLRPFYARHVLLPRARLVMVDGAVRFRRLFSGL